LSSLKYGRHETLEENDMASTLKAHTSDASYEAVEPLIDAEMLYLNFDYGIATCS